MSKEKIKQKFFCASLFLLKSFFYRLIMPNRIEVLDVATEDPFTESNIPEWLPVEQFQELDDEALKLLSEN